jgi:hypothetical protein
VALFELANAWLTVGDHAQARECIERAMASSKFTGEDLESPWLARTGRSFLMVSATELRANGENAAADQRLAQLEKLLARMEDAGVRTSGLYELKAQLAAAQGRADAAVAALKRAVDLGWSAAWLAEHEPYFNSLRGREDFRALLAAVRARNARTAAMLKERPTVSGKDRRLGQRSVSWAEARCCHHRPHLYADVVFLHQDVHRAGDLVRRKATTRPWDFQGSATGIASPSGQPVSSTRLIICFAEPGSPSGGTIDASRRRNIARKTSVNSVGNSAFWFTVGRGQGFAVPDPTNFFTEFPGIRTPPCRPR